MAEQRRLAARLAGAVARKKTCVIAPQHGPMQHREECHGREPCIEMAWMADGISTARIPGCSGAAARGRCQISSAPASMHASLHVQQLLYAAGHVRGR